MGGCSWLEHRLTFPTTEDEIRKLRAGDLVTVDGHIIGIRDRTQVRIFDQGVEPPLDLSGAFLLHTAPNVRKRDDGTYEPMRVGTTTSARMVRFTEPLGRDHGVRAICGKGGLPDEAIEPMRRYGMVYFAIVGGAAALETTQIEEIEDVAWEELMPECLWKFRVKDFGRCGPASTRTVTRCSTTSRQATKNLEELFERSDLDLLPPRTAARRTSSTRAWARACRGPAGDGGPYIDIVKLGWGTGVRHAEPRSEARALRETARRLGGTFFEVVYVKNKLDEYSPGSLSSASRMSRSRTARSRCPASGSWS